jgi:dolichol-phosphate mannosyltransferase
VNRGPLLSIVTPAYNEARNLPLLHARLASVLDTLGLAWQWIIVDDHSADDTFVTADALARRDDRVQAIRLARNVGSHASIQCGLSACTGDATVVMASDLQDPPEAIPALVSRWRAGADVVWAARAARPGIPLPRRLLARLYHEVVRRLGRLASYPPAGADFLLLARAARDRLLATGGGHDLFVTVARLDVRQAVIECGKQPRLHGRSGWTLRCKLRLAFGGLWTAVRPMPRHRIAPSWRIEATTPNVNTTLVIPSAARDLLRMGHRAPHAGDPSLRLAAPGMTKRTVT